MCFCYLYFLGNIGYLSKTALPIWIYNTRSKKKKGNENRTLFEKNHQKELDTQKNEIIRLTTLLEQNLPFESITTLDPRKKKTMKKEPFLRKIIKKN
jgi:hypothetical protein